MDHDSLRLLEPRSTFDQFIIGVVDIPEGVSTATLYDKDRIVEYFTQEIYGEIKPFRGAIDQFNCWARRHCSCCTLFCSHKDYTYYSDAQKEPFRFLEPRSTYDQFILGLIYIPEFEGSAVSYDKDRIIKHLIQEERESGDDEDLEIISDRVIEHFYYNLLPLCPTHILFCSHDDYMHILEMDEDHD